MKDSDHIALADKILAEFDIPAIRTKKSCKRAYYLGVLLPDFNPFTYVRGVWKSRRMAGHDHLYSAPTVEKIITRLQKSGVKTVRDCYSLGAMLHYVSDSFTHPHTQRFVGKLTDHKKYERELHEVFPKILEENERIECSKGTPALPLKFLTTVRKVYESMPVTPKNDALFILSVSEALCRSLFYRKEKRQDKRF